MFLPKTLSGRLVLLVLATLMLMQMVSLLVYMKDRDALISDAGSRLMLQRITALVRLMDQSVPEQYEMILKATANGQFVPYLDKEPLVNTAATTGVIAGLQEKIDHITQRSPEQGIRMNNVRPMADCGSKPPFRGGGNGREGGGRRHGGRDGQHRYQPPIADCSLALHVSVPLLAGGWLNIRTGDVEEPLLWNWRSALGLMLVGMVVVGLMLWILRNNTRPLQKLAEAAERIGRGMDSPPLEEKGAQEVRSTIQAFNRMQERQQRFIKDRTLMLAAISHDLKTPLTKLRLQSEFVSDSEIQAKMLHTLAEMDSMLAATMNFARDDMQNEASRPTDLVSLIQSLCDDLTDTGANISTDLPDRLVCECKPMSMRRMMGNVLENAVKYADTATVTLRKESGQIIITVMDDGPGIDPALFEQVFTPFYRVEGSRNRDTGGMGLGLSVVRSIAHLHGGEVHLSNVDGGGLSVAIHLL